MARGCAPMARAGRVALCSLHPNTGRRIPARMIPGARRDAPRRAPARNVRTPAQRNLGVRVDVEGALMNAKPPRAGRARLVMTLSLLALVVLGPLVAATGGADAAPPPTPAQAHVLRIG